VKRHFSLKVPKKPLLKRRTYTVPDEYSAVYAAQGVVGSDEQIMLFHVTQFGGFHMRSWPSDLTIHPDFVSTWLTHKFETGRQYYGPNAKFLECFGQIPLQPLYRRWKLDPVPSYEDMRACGYEDEEIRTIRTFLESLNAFYSSLRVAISMPESGITAEDRLHLSKFHGIPFLRVRPHAGGRFFHPESSYQRTSAVLRRTLTINDEPTTEIDLSAATLQFMNIALQAHDVGSLEDAVLNHDDPYTYFLELLNSSFVSGDIAMDRDTLKQVLYTAIYSTSAREPGNVNHKLQRLGFSYRHADLVSWFPEFFTALSALRTSTGRPLHMVINAEESRYCRRVLESSCLEAGFPVLPLHDSFITTQSSGQRLLHVMEETSRRLYGRRLSYKIKHGMVVTPDPIGVPRPTTLEMRTKQYLLFE
jgi:hypothetical protein